MVRKVAVAVMDLRSLLIRFNTEVLKNTCRMDNLEIPEIICLCLSQQVNLNEIISTYPDVHPFDNYMHMALVFTSQA